MNKYIVGIMTLIAGAALAAAVPVLAETNKPTDTNKPMETKKPEVVMKKFVFGNVSKINGNTITLVGRTNFGKATTTSTYTVDATNAKITRNNASTTVANIAVGDTLVVQGTFDGTKVAAATITDNAGRPGLGLGRDQDKRGTSTNPMMNGNGQPITMGTITAIGSSTISITNKSNATYTVDTTNAKIVQGKNTITLSDLKVGNTVVVQGTINGTSVTASSVINQVKPANVNRGFFGNIGQFFKHLFGF